MKNSFKTIINVKTLVLVDFFADWCSPCKTLSPILNQVKQELGDAIKIIKINVDKNESLSVKYQIKGIPTMLLFKKGKLLWRQSGVLQKNDIISIIKQHS